MGSRVRRDNSREIARERVRERERERERGVESLGFRFQSLGFGVARWTPKTAEELTVGWGGGSVEGAERECEREREKGRESA